MTTLPPGGGYSPIGKDPKQMGFVSSSLPATDKTQVDPTVLTSITDVQSTDATVVPETDSSANAGISSFVGKGICQEDPGFDNSVKFGDISSGSKTADIPKINLLTIDDISSNSVEFDEEKTKIQQTLLDAEDCLSMNMKHTAKYLLDNALEATQRLEKSILHAHEAAHVVNQQGQ